MRPIEKYAFLIALMVSSCSAFAERSSINREAPYENKAAISIEYEKNEHKLFNEALAVSLVADRTFSAADKLVIVAKALPGNLGNLTLADQRLRRLVDQLVSSGVPDSRVSTLIQQDNAASDVVDIFVVPHTWNGLPSSVVRQSIKDSPGTHIVVDRPSGLDVVGVGQVLVKDGNAVSSFEDFTNQIGWERFEQRGLENQRLPYPLELNFDSLSRPFKTEKVVELLESIWKAHADLKKFDYRVFPNEKAIFIYKEQGQ